MFSIFIQFTGDVGTSSWISSVSKGHLQKIVHPRPLFFGFAWGIFSVFCLDRVSKQDVRSESDLMSDSELNGLESLSDSCLSNLLSG